MSLIDSVKRTATKAVDFVKHGVSDAVEQGKVVAEQVADKVERAPDAISAGARAAVAGAKEIKHKVETGRGGEVLDSAVRGAQQGVQNLGKVATNVGHWAWENKAEIGFWLGTSALVLAAPLSGGASGALAGGMIAARAASIGVRVAKMGKIGATAVNLARTGAAAVRSTKAALSATTGGRVLARGGGALRSGREWLGGTHVGKAMLAAQAPVGTAALLVGGANFLDTANKHQHGAASTKDLALSSLGIAPGAFLVSKSVAARHAARAGDKAADKSVMVANATAAHAAEATDDLAHVARVAPVVRAPETAGAAAAATNQGVGTVNKAVEVQRAALAKGAAGDDVSTQALANKLSDVEAQIKAAKAQAAYAESVAPRALTSTARTGRKRFDTALKVASNGRRQVQKLANRERRATTVANGSEKAETALNTTSVQANWYANMRKAARESKAEGVTMTEANVYRTALSLAMKSNARGGAAPAASQPAAPLIR